MFYDFIKSHFTKFTMVIALAVLTATGNLLAEDAPAATPSTTTASASADAQMEPAAVAQAEVIRRQELVFRASQAIGEAEKAESNGDISLAQQKYQFALDNLSPSANTAAALSKARSGMVRVSLQQYEIAKKNGDTATAVKSLEAAAKYDPSNSSIRDRLAKIKETQANPAKGSLLGNPAVTPQFVDNVKAIEQLLIDAEQFKRTGQFDDAEARYNKILTIDPYNQKAMAGLKGLTVAKQEYARAAQLETRTERLRQVEEGWAIKPKPDILSHTATVAATPFTRSTQFAINQKLKSYIIKDLVFNDATIEEAANALAAKSKELDPEAKLGISFIVKPEAVSTAKTFSLNLRNIPMEDALRYITKLAGVKYKVEEFAVVIVPLKESIEVLLRRSFNVSPSFFPPPAAAAADTAGGGGRRPPPVVQTSVDSSAGTNDVKSQLEERGVDFKTPGSSAVYYPGSGVLQVINTQEQLDLIEELVNAGATPTYMVDVAVKLVEIAQTDLNELTVNTGFNIAGLAGAAVGTPAFGTVPVDANGVPSGEMTAGTQLRGSQGFNVGNIDSLLHQNNLTSATGATPTPNIFGIQGHIGNNIFNMVFSALAQKQSFDLLSAPSLRVKNGEDATINVSRTFYYPTSFDPAESASVQSVSFGGSIAVGPAIVIPTFPTEFESRDIGVKMKVRPQLGADNRTIDLALFPEVTDFEGFINYGSPIYVAGGTLANGVDPLNNPSTVGSGNAYLLSSNVINQPVFNTRRIDTKVLVRDGYTVVLGGLMRDDVQTITDKVPFLGDLPLVGRLFQSKATQSQKKNLLIFVTCRIYLNNGELLNPPTTTMPVAASGLSSGTQ